MNFRASCRRKYSSDRNGIGGENRHTIDSFTGALAESIVSRTHRNGRVDRDGCHVYHDARPFVSDHSTRLLISHAPDNGFPSDHGLVAFAVAGAILPWHRLLGVLALGTALLIGIARIYVGVHWPSDIAGAAAIGLFAAAIAWFATPLLQEVQRQLGRFLPEPLIYTSPR